MSKCAAQVRFRGQWLGIALLLAFSSGVQAQNSSQDAGELKELQREIEILKERLRQLEQRLPAHQSPASPRDQELLKEARALEKIESEPVAVEDLGQAVPGSERLTQELAEDPADEVESEIQLGGALRFNLVHRDFVAASKTKRGESGLDVFRLNIDGKVDNILISAEYRYYSYMQTIHHGWLGYEFEDQSQLQFGIHRVPFGLLPYAAHNAWFGVPYYVGLADNYDMGVKYQREDGPWTSHLAFYKNEELNDATDLGRYALDLVRVGEQQNEKTNQANARLAYTFGKGSDCETELGGSAQTGELYNATTDGRGDHWAAAAHIDSRCGRWNFQLQGSRYEFNPVAPAGVDPGSIRVGAFEASYDVASSADIAVANIAYNFDSPWPHVEQIICYNDYSRLFKDSGAALDSEINTLGCAIGSGALFAYVDYILANNMAFFGDGSMAGGGEDDWHSRFNVNIGFYW